MLPDCLRQDHDVLQGVNFLAEIECLPSTSLRCDRIYLRTPTRLLGSSVPSCLQDHAFSLGDGLSYAVISSYQAKNHRRDTA